MKKSDKNSNTGNDEVNLNEDSTSIEEIKLLGKWMMIKGVGFILFGLLLGKISYFFLKSGSYIIFLGFFGYGATQLGEGIYCNISPKKAIKYMTGRQDTLDSNKDN